MRHFEYNNRVQQLSQAAIDYRLFFADHASMTICENEVEVSFYYHDRQKSFEGGVLLGEMFCEPFEIEVKEFEASECMDGFFRICVALRIGD